MNQENASNLQKYYADRPGLKEYTLGVEMDRMDYVLKTHDGMTLEKKDDIRRYFNERSGVTNSKEEEIHEILIRSANQSLLADALVSLTGLEDGILNSDDFINNKQVCLILSGPLLCMTSIAEYCKFIIDLPNGLVQATCGLAIGIPNPNGERLVLARSTILVRFRPGNIEWDEESSIQYAVETVEACYSPDDPVIHSAVVSLALDQRDCFAQQPPSQVEENVTDVRDLFLLNHHLLSDSHLLAVSERIKASSTGFRSALRQLDGVTGVSGKLNLIKNATGVGGGFLSLPSAQEIEEAEREATAGSMVASGGHFSRLDNVVLNDESGEVRFPRPMDMSTPFARDASFQGHARPPPPPPPPPPSQMNQGQDASRPRPLIGGMFLSGLSRLAAAATQPNEPQPYPGTHYYSNQPDNQSSNQLSEDKTYIGSSYHIPQWDGATGGTGLTPAFAENAHPSAPFASLAQQAMAQLHHLGAANNDVHESKAVTLPAKDYFKDADEMDGGWSDDGLDFEDEDTPEERNNATVDIQSVSEPTWVTSSSFKKLTAPSVENSCKVPPPPSETKHKVTEAEFKFPGEHQVPPPYPPTASKSHSKPTATFEEEFVIVLKEKVEEEEKAMKESGRTRRWRPISEDPVCRQRLLEVMVNQLDRS